MEGDGIVAELGRKFGEWKESAADPTTKPAVEEDTAGKLVAWLRDADIAQTAPGEKDERIEELEKLVLELEETLLERAILPGPDQNPATTSSSTLNSSSQRSIIHLSLSSPSSSPSDLAVLFTIRRSGGETSELPIPVLTAWFGQHVPLPTLTCKL